MSGLLPVGRILSCGIVVLDDIRLRPTESTAHPKVGLSATPITQQFEFPRPGRIPVICECCHGIFHSDSILFPLPWCGFGWVSYAAVTPLRRKVVERRQNDALFQIQPRSGFIYPSKPSPPKLNCTPITIVAWRYCGLDVVRSAVTQQRCDLAECNRLSS